jgi:hypothetical protein
VTTSTVTWTRCSYDIALPELPKGFRPEPEPLSEVLLQQMRARMAKAGGATAVAEQADHVRRNASRAATGVQLGEQASTQDASRCLSQLQRSRSARVAPTGGAPRNPWGLGMRASDWRRDVNRKWAQPPTRATLERVARRAGTEVSTVEALAAGLPVPPSARDAILLAAAELKVVL